ncbi:hypothetical protein EBZ80_22015 [bacterium]|nr:hypothetical protein [bacterium]
MTTVYPVYYLSKTSSVIRPCEPPTIRFFPVDGCGNYNVVLCLDEYTLTGKGTASGGAVTTLTIQFMGTTNATAILNTAGTQGTLTLVSAAAPPVSYFMNYLLTYP